MKKLLLTLTVAGVLAAPAGVLVAQDSGTDVPDTTESTVLEPDQDRDQVRDRDGTCDEIQAHEQNQAGVEDGSGHGPQAREQNQAGVENDAGNGPQNGSCVGDCEHDQLRTQDRLRDETCDSAADRDRDQLRDGTGG